VLTTVTERPFQLKLPFNYVDALPILRDAIEAQSLPSLQCKPQYHFLTVRRIIKSTLQHWVAGARYASSAVGQPPAQVVSDR
jgi:hypothetical protein